MALYGSRYIQSIDPGAVGVGFEWLNDTTGDLSVRNMSNTGWVLVGNISKPYLGQINEGGGTMLGPLTGVTGWAPNTSPDFSTSAKLGGIDLATQQYVNDQISSLSIVINDRISEAIVTATSSVNVKSNFKVKVSTGSTSIAGFASPWVVDPQTTLATVVLPQYDNGVTANPEDCVAFCWKRDEDVDPLALTSPDALIPTMYSTTGSMVTSGPFRAVLSAGTPTTSGVPVLCNLKYLSAVASAGTTLSSTPIDWVMVIIAARG